MTKTIATSISAGRSRHIQAVIIGWVVMIGVDFIIHGGILAKLYAAPSPFLLPPEDAFRLIPVGYASFLLLSIFVYWLMQKAGVQGGRKSFVFGLTIGLLGWGALILGLYSIATADPILLVGWWLGQSIELGVGAGFINHALETSSIRKTWGRVLLLVLVMVILTVIIQNLGLAPAGRIIN